jgi:Na+/proline symporter
VAKTPADTDETAAPGDPTAAFLAALRVRRNGVIGVVSGLLVGLLVYAGFVAVPASTTFPRSLYVPLILVVAFGVAVVVAVVLTAVAAWRQIRALEDA